MPQPRRAGLHAVVWATLLAGTALAAPAATAATATPDQAQAVERELHDWMQGLLGTAIAAPDRPVQLTPEGDGYALAIPLGPDTAITGHLAPQDDGRWLLSDAKIPSPASFTLAIPAMPQSSQESSQESGQAPAMTRTYQFSVGRQEISGVLDPSYKAPSSLQQRFEAVQVSSSGSGFKQASQAARSLSGTTLTPTADGRFDLASSTTLEGYGMDTRADNGFSVHMAAERGSATLQLGSIAPGKGSAFLRNAIAVIVQTFAEINRAKGEPPHLTPEQQAQLRAEFRALVEALDGFASTMQASDTLENVQVQAGNATANYGGIARRANIGFGADAPDGVLKTYLDVGVEGLSLPGLLAGFGIPVQYADLVPTDFHLRPTLAGIGTKALLDLARQDLDAMDRGEKPAPPDPASLFAHGGIVAGLDAVAFNLGPAKFAGHGAVTFTAPSPDAFAGQGQVTATGLEALMDRAKQDPAMQQALPLLTFAKGIGRTNGDQIVWDITYQDGKALVNGIDVMAMAGAAGSHGDRPSTTRPPAVRAPASPGKLLPK